MQHGVKVHVLPITFHIRITIFYLSFRQFVAVIFAQHHLEITDILGKTYANED